LNGISPENFQAALANSTSDPLNMMAGVVPHHPISCGSSLAYDEDGVMSCAHAKVGPECPRNQLILNASAASLIFEMAHAMGMAP
jgi:hypothetical protein